jgi:hypothetical protein
MSTAQRIGFIVLIVVGVVAAVYAFEYLTVAIHHLPSWVPGRHRGHGHYHKRGAILGLIAVLCLGGAGYIFYRARSQGGAGGSDGEATTAAATPAAQPAAQDAGAPAQDASSLLGGAEEPPKE